VNHRRSREVPCARLPRRVSSTQRIQARLVSWGMVCVALCIVVIGCSGTPGDEQTANAGSSVGGHSAASGSSTTGFGGSGAALQIDCNPTPGSASSCPGTSTDVCGDGILSQGEACDDGNTAGGDGCNADCSTTEPGYSCNPPGKACQELVVCGDGILAPSEQCDDGGSKAGNGCSAHCQFEAGFKCQGEPSVCTPTICGDRLQEGAETCDDGNQEPFDGCSASCQAEPSCSGDACSSKCGDGLLIAEECDDGNTTNGDGCGSTCRIEAGFVCSQLTECDKLAGKCVLRVPALFRDFQHTHSDFEQAGCGSQTAVPGIVQNGLSPRGKPVLAANGPKVCIASAASFAEWYTNTPNNSPIVGELVLFDNGNGGFVNRWGANGERWTEGGTPLDGTPFFFPIDNSPKALTDTRYDAATGPPYAADLTWESAVVPGAGQHNFHFTTEVRYWFVFEAAKAASLAFTGDDDVWVFVNGKLALDLGGLHPPASGSVVLDAAAASTYGLADGKVYAISIFHAERHTEGSSFRLTLGGFNTARSICVPNCGDGIVSAGEQCDDGINDGGYGECDPGCVVGAYCGDGVRQGSEECDDHNRVNADGCSSSCRKEIVK